MSNTLPVEDDAVQATLIPTRPAGLGVVNGLRFGAALAVLLYHFASRESSAWGRSPGTLFPRVSHWTAFGAFGVELFLVMSGFVILMTAWGRTVPKFVASRIRRLFPAYRTGVLLTGAERQHQRQHQPPRRRHDASKLDWHGSAYTHRSTRAQMPSDASPLISLVVACYEVAEYLPEFIESVDVQLTDAVEVIMVIDGSTDDSAKLALDWANSTRHRVTVVEQENQGVAGARNSGMAVASGRWISFPDPDDVLAQGYLDSVLGMLTSSRADELTLVSTNVVPVAGTIQKVIDNHPLRFKYHRGERVLRLSDNPDHIQLATHTAFMRLDVLRKNSIRFDDRIRPVFEDAHFVGRYLLLAAEDPLLGILPDARYLYRRRSDASSLMDSVWHRREKYDDVLRYGHLDLLRIATERGGVPRWLQNTMIYDLVWYFKVDAEVQSPTGGLTDEQSTTLQGLLRSVMSHVDSETIRAFRLVGITNEIRTALMALSGPLPSPSLELDTIDHDRRLTRLTYYTDVDGPAPWDFEYSVDGRAVEPAFEKRRSVNFLGKTLFLQGIVWLPGVGEIAAQMNGSPVSVGRPSSTQKDVLALLGPTPSRLKALRGAIRWGLHLARHDRQRLLKALVQLDLSRRGASGKPSLLQRVIRERSKFHDCWLLIDRDTEAHDNAEHLYRYLRQERPDINAWFVLNRDSPDWSRLSKGGFRLVPHGSLRHAVALAQCSELISSQIDHYIVSPKAALFLRNRPWRFTWLQHGVIQSDLSRWLNSKKVSAAVTTTPQEYDSIAGDGSPYTWTPAEVILTGQPRHDELIRKVRAVPDGARHSIVIMPTWRQELLVNAGPGNARVPAPNFWESAYVRNWLGLLQSQAVHAAAEESGLELVFMPHPTIAPHISAEHVPNWVRIDSYVTDDVQDVIAHASHVVTDYSSVAFDAALADRPILYFQFDADTFLAGTHIGRNGYFDYERDGFGPVTSQLEDAETALVALIRYGKLPAEPYASRIASTFTIRDGRACERIVAAISARRTPHASGGTA